ncbi:MAG TPA: 3-deoxy-8-phosphooctulonate synthase, partial [Methylomirabilota bacterium]|nr:3-deoxy-8-phosphooctulonate synthase [Methylomirabilota bacterium]
MANHAPPHRIRIRDLTVANDRPLTLIAGPCAIESRSHALEMGQALTEITRKLGVGLIYKS